MSERNSIARTLHDVGLAAWFGGSLMGSVGLNGAAATAKDSSERPRIASAGWSRWTPVNLAAIGAHLVGGAMIAAENRNRVKHQQGVAAMTAIKTGLTAAALGVTAYSRVVGQKVISADNVPASGATEPSGSTPPDTANAQRQLQALQWLVPALTGGILVANAYAGEQQRPSQVAKGVVLKAARRATGLTSDAADRARDLVA